MHSLEKESGRAARIEKKRKELFRRYPRIWNKILDEWESGPDSAWLTYSANYLLRTAGVRWAVDPLTACGRFRGKNYPPSKILPAEDIRKLEPLSFVLLTHGHDDHADERLMEMLKDCDIKWVAPGELRPVLEKAGLRQESVIFPEHGRKFSIKRVAITAFEGLHYRLEPEKPLVPSNAYLVEAGGRKLFFPGDVRTYDGGKIPFSGPVDWIFSHLWLGVDSMDDELPILDEFCRFALKFRPKNILLSHVHEIARGPGSCWFEEHVEMAVSLWKKLAPRVNVAAPDTGERLPL